ncbi:MAG: ATPase, T2SS/T4P/T4SS family [Candidatus Eisenbacteria bacterium]
MGRIQKKQLGEILVEAGLIGEQDLKKYLFEKLTTDMRLGEFLVEKGVCTEEDVARALSTQLGYEYADPKGIHVEAAAISAIPEKLARKHEMLPIQIHMRELMVVMADPTNVAAVEDAQFVSSYEIRPLVAPRSALLKAIDKHYSIESSVEEIVKDITASNVEVLDDSKESSVDLKEAQKQSQAPPIIRMVNQIIATAVDMGASDIHIEPARESLTIRYRIDGHLRKELELPKWVQGAVLSRAKLMAHMDIAEKRIPQDGRFGVRIGIHRLDLRASTLPTNFGEKIVMRILDSESSQVGIENLGMEEEMKTSFLSIVSRPQGLVLVTGPTGSGKTTTLYSALGHINTVEKNITTIEDPIEYELAGVNQVQIDEKAGRNFANVLSSILRQDPDVVMVGEMRDLETATIALQASLTGHLVLSTLHTNSTIETITRLRNLGLPSYLIASAVHGILAQRLVRRICPNCRAPAEPAPEKLVRLGIPPSQASKHRFFEGAGCEQCGKTGYSGRTAIHEFLVFSRRIREAVAGEGNESTIRQLALAEKTRMLLAAGLEKLEGGLTTVDELLRAIQVDAASGTACPKCAQVISPEFVACPACGHRLIHTCGACRAVVDPDWAHCPYCSAERGAAPRMGAATVSVR